MSVLAPPGVALEVYGLRIWIEGDWPEVVEAVRLDFEWFERPGDVGGGADVRVTVERRPPDYDSQGDLTSAFVTPRNVVYRAGRRTAIDYFGRALAVLERGSEALCVQGEDAHLVHEAVYLYVLSRVGEHLDARGLPRLHAVGLAGREGAVAVVLPSGGGKSTLALRALGDDAVTLLSEDSPLLDRRGLVHPFPLRIGVNASDAALLSPGSFRRIERMEFHPKVVLALSAFADRIERRPQPLRHLVLGRRSLGRTASLEPVGRRAAIGPLLRECVVGVGLYQGMEFVLQRGTRDVAAKAGTAGGRALCASACLRRARVWRLTLGRDHERNWQALRRLL